MKRLMASLSVELLKIQRSKVFWLTILVSLFIPVMCGIMMWIIMNPESAMNLNLLRAKAYMLAGKADWQTFFTMLFMMVAMGGIIIFGFVTSWVFGREYADRTIKDILALPASRTTIVISKFIVVLLWCSLLSIIIFIIGIISGFAVGLPGWSLSSLLFAGKVYIITASLTVLLCPPVGFFASASRGYLLPLGFIILMILVGQFITHLGWGAYFPWTIPAIYSGIAGPAEASLIGFISGIIMLFTAVIGLAGTIIWWQLADQK